MNEGELQQAVMEMAGTFGWYVAHFRPALTKHGWRTPVSADGKGFPDLVLVNPTMGKILYRELKADKGKLSPEQVQWGEWLTAAGADYAVWRPADWKVIVFELSGGRATAL